MKYGESVPLRRRAEGGEPVGFRRQTTGICRVHPPPGVIDENIPENQGLDLVHRHPVCRDAVDQFLLQGGEEALHPGIVVAMRHATETLDETVRRQRLPKSVAGVLAATV